MFAEDWFPGAGPVVPTLLCQLVQVNRTPWKDAFRWVCPPARTGKTEPFFSALPSLSLLTRGRQAVGESAHGQLERNFFFLTVQAYGLLNLLAFHNGEEGCTRWKVPPRPPQHWRPHREP